ncbi:SDR family NAD(P)-dependent oxidoreductase [Streptomyces sp. NPDC048001]|uniref:SDR family NAD(P)-dependent oxidoreductase n=1 Tax=Streptomyces sp. NPDC048001 TaxID=3365498 RepID=UPI00371726B7
MPANATPKQPSSSGSSPSGPAAPSAEEVRGWLVAAVAEATGTRPPAVDPERPLAELGLGSRQLVTLAADLAEYVDRPLNPALLFDHPTITAIARAVAGPPAPHGAPQAAPAPGTGAPDAPAEQQDIAVVSMACRFPGGADDPESLWRLLCSKEDAVTEVPPGRWDTRGLHDPDPEATGTAYSLRGGYLADIDRFDAAFFGISPREAEAMDPQQRLLLQTAWEAVERAGIVPGTLHGSSTGVYVGLYESGYLASAGLDRLDGHVGTGAAPSVASGRIAYSLGLQGPAVTVDTACSSSLVALHLAARALAAGECDLALAGGATLLVTPRGHVEFSRLRGLSPTGRCSAFSAEADGVVWAEGCGLVLLKRLADARRDGDRVLAVVKGSAVNQDGRSQGLSAPNGPAQERVVRAALESAGLRPEDIDHVEAHGTGTRLGDPVEGGALAAVFGPGRPADRPLGVGSLKSRIGHTQAAAGIGGVIATVLALGRERIPASLHTGRPTPLVDWAGGGLRLLDAPRDWPRTADRVRRAGVSAFGISGTNAHVVLEEAPDGPGTGSTDPVRPDAGSTVTEPDARPDAGSTAPEPDARPDAGSTDPGRPDAGDARPGAGPRLFPLSARSLPALRGQAARLAGALTTAPELTPGQVAGTLAHHRTHFPHRAVVLAGDREELTAALRGLAEGAEEDARVVRAEEPAPRDPGRTAFVFPGQGSQWAGMARDLLAGSPVFAEALDRCDAALRQFTDWSVAAVLRGETGAPSLERVDVVQPVLFAVGVSLAAVWRERGVRPDAVVGHSQGEVAAACVAGALSLNDAAAVVALRSRALTALSGSGGMAVVGLPHGEVAARLADPGGALSVAAVNSGRSTVVAGPVAALTALLGSLDAEGVFARRLAVDYASHCELVEPVREEILDELDGVTAWPGSGATWYSTVTGEPVTGELEAEYWYRNLREPVRFADTVERMAADGYRTFVELSPHPSLLTALRTVAEETGAAARADDGRPALLAVGSLRREEPAARCLERAAAELHAGGRPVDWRVLAPAPPSPAALPTYAWDAQRFWSQPTAAAQGPGLFERAAHPLLGVQVQSPDESRWTFRGEWSAATAEWLGDHTVFGRTVVSGTTVLELCRAALAAARPGAEVADLFLAAPLVLPDSGTVEVSVEVAAGPGQEPGGGGPEVTVHSRPRGREAAGWSLHATAVAAEAAGGAAQGPAPAWPGDAAPAWGPDAYERLAARGLGYGPAFRGVREAVATGDGALLARLSLPPAARADAEPYPVHPALLDAALQVATAFDQGAADGSGGRVLLPVAVGRCTLPPGAGGELLASVRRSAETAGDLALDVLLWDADGLPAGRLEGVRLRAAAPADLHSASEAGRNLYEVAWSAVTGPGEDASREAGAAAEGPRGGWVVAGGARDPLAAGTARALGARTADGDPAAGADASAGGAPSPDPLPGAGGDPAPGAVRVRFWPSAAGGGPSPAPEDGELPAALRALAEEALDELRSLLSAPPGGAPERTVWVTCGAVAAAPGDTVPSLAASVLWGLARSARAEHPELGLTLLDLDPGPGLGLDPGPGADPDPGPGADRPAEESAPGPATGAQEGAAAAAAALARAAALTEEPELALRGGVLLAPRLVRSRPAGGPQEPPHPAAGPAQWSPEHLPVPTRGTVLVTGGLGAVGRRIAALLAEQGVPRLLLTSRRGESDPRAAEVAAELAALGAEVEVAACDTGDGEAVAALLDRLTERDGASPHGPEDAGGGGSHRELRGVVHCAGVLADGAVAELTEEQFAEVLRPKADGAAHLHRLTRDLPLELFLLVSSAAGVVGSPGQANYAAANAFLDQLAHHRRAAGLPGVSVSFGAWAGEGLAAAHADLARMARLGHRALSPGQGRDLVELALWRDVPHTVATALDLPRLREAVQAAGGGPAAALWRTLLPAPPPAAAGTALADRLARLSEAERVERVAALVREEAARALGLPSAAAVPADRPLRELGMDSVTAVELRGRIGTRIGARLPATLLFDHPTPARLAAHLLRTALAVPGEGPAATAVRPAAARQGAGEPVAVVSMACRLPGGVRDPEGLQHLLGAGTDAIGPFPRDRWDVEALYDPDPEAPGKSYAREGGFLDDIASFDAAFFGITPKEAAAMDPQQRLLLETAWEALERAGIVPGRLAGTSTGVYVGMFASEYLAGSPLDRLDGYVGTGSAPSVASGRLAYTLGLNGPALTVDTACSSSLVAVHLAAQGLRAGECDLALAGGVTLMVTPGTFVEFSRLRGLSPTGRCRSFSDEADGAVWAEGSGVVVLKRLSDAERDGDEVLAVLRGTAVNQDGRSQGLSAPNGPAQEQVVRRALELSGLAPSDIDYVEAHGTGTTLGDPIEANALSAVFGGTRPPGRPLLLGSLKSNLGHTQAASGVAGLIKVVQSLRHGTLPRTLHADRPSRHVDWEDGGLRLLTEPADWPAAPGRVRRAGVSAFGISGTNAHVVVEEAPRASTAGTAAPAGAPADGRPGPAGEDVPRLFLLSARSEAALRGQAGRLSRHVAGDVPVEDVAYSLLRHRSHFERRAAVVAADRAELRSALDALAAGRTPVAPACEERTGKTAFVFPGHGGQWHGMGVELMAASGPFREELLRIDEALRRRAGWSAVDALRAPEEFSPLHRTEFLQPVLFALDAALAAAWRELGVVPDGVVGHSLGEIAAAYAAGALPLDEAVRVVTGRAEAVVPLVGQGGMLSVELPEQEAAALLEPYAGRLFVAALNGPRATAVSGAAGELAELRRALEARGVGVRRLSTPFASHTPLMEPLRGELRERFAGVRGTDGGVPLYSAVRAEAVSGEDLDADYWFANLARPVRFAEAVHQMLRDGYRTFVELSPHPSLSAAVQSVAAEAGVEVVTTGSLDRRRDRGDVLLHRLGELYTAGRTPEGGRLAASGRRTPLPAYAFDRARHWLAPAPAGPAGVSPLLGAHMEASDTPGRHLFQSEVDLRDTRFAYLSDHRVGGEVWLPASAFLGMALEAAAAVRDQGAGPAGQGGGGALSGVRFERPLRLPADRAVRLQLVLRQEADGQQGFTVSSAPAGERPVRWERHVTGRIVPDAPDGGGAGQQGPAELRERCAAPVDTAAVYTRLAGLGIEYGPAFRGLREAHRGRGAALGRLAARPADGHLLHPAVLDAAFHAAALPEGAPEGRPFVPAGVGLVRYTGQGTAPVRVGCELRSAGEDRAVADLRLWDAEDRLVLECRGLELAALSPLDNALFETVWRARSAPREPAGQGHWLILADEGGTARDLDGLLGPGTPRVVVRRGPGFAQEGPGRYALDPADPEQFVRLLDEAFPDGPPERVVQLSALDTPAVSDAPSAREAARLCCLATLHLVRALTGRPGPAPRLFVVVRGSQAALPGDRVTAPWQALAWGFGLTVAQEHPELATTLVDLPASGGADALCTELRHADGERLVALRESGRLVPRLARTRPDGSGDGAVTAEGVHLVTGGLGGLGRVVAERLAGLGARRLALLGRGAPAPEAEAWMEELRGRGVDVRAVRADVADRAGLAAALDSVRRGLGPVTGIVHTAGVLDDAPLAALTEERMLRVLAPKVLGTALLAELAPEAESLVLFASAAGLLGSAGQAPYAAANAFLDAWAHHAGSGGLRALSLDWGAWSGVGMAAESGERAAGVRRSGLVPFSPREGGELFARVLGSERRQLAPLAVDWEVLGLDPDAVRTRPLLAELVAAPAGDPAEDALAAAVLAAPAGPGRVARLEGYVRARVGAVSGGAVDASSTTALKELGLDSLMLVQLRNVFARELGVELPAAAVFSASDIQGLAGVLDAALPDAAGAAPRRGEAAGAPAAGGAPAEVPESELRPATRDVVRLLRSARPDMPGAAHAVGLAVRLLAPVTREALAAALDRLAARHAALRTAVVAGGGAEADGNAGNSRNGGNGGGGWRLRVDRAPGGPLLRWTGVRPGEEPADPAGRLRALLEPPFDLARPPLWRFELLDGGEQGQILVFGAHHAVSDLQSLLLVAAELDAELSGTVLPGEVTNRDIELLIEAQQSGGAPDAGTRARDAAWREAFEGSGRLDLVPPDARPATRSYRAGSVSVPLPEGLMDRVSAAAGSLAVTPAAFCLGVLTVLLARRRNRERFVLAVPVDTRVHADAYEAVGFFGVPVPFPAQAGPAEAVADVLRRTDARLEQVLGKGTAFTDTLATLARQGLYRENAPLVEVYFNYVRSAARGLSRMEVLPAGTGWSDLDLMVTMTPDAGRVRLDHNLDILDEGAVSALAGQFLELLDEAARHPAAPVGGARPAGEDGAPAALPAVAEAAGGAPLPDGGSPRGRTLALAATFALGHLPLMCATALADGEPGPAPVVAEAPYHQVLASLRDPSGVFADPDAAAGVVLLRAGDLARFGPVDDALLSELARAYPAALRELAARTRRPLVVGILPSARPEPRFTAWERQVAEALRGVPGIALVTAESWTGGHAVGELFDERTEQLAHLPFTPPFQAAVALRLAGVLRAALRPVPKVIAVDGDETLWGGVAGEAGPEAVDLSGPRAELARRLLRWHAAGTLLVLVSNNDEDTVRSVLKRPDCLLAAEHFAVVSAAWGPKPDRLAQAASALNLGLDSFLFLDDNPAEIARMRAALPQVLSVTCPEGPGLEEFLDRLWPLVPVAATAEDALRARFYREERERDAVRAQAGFEEFLAELGLEVEVRPLDEEDVPRAEQLVRRTNQFTLRARSADGGDLARWRRRGEVWTASARDRFGDYGQIGLLAVRPEGERLEVDAWLMSCRALGRGVEERLLGRLADRAEELGCSAVRFTAERTPRNEPARRIVAALGGGTVQDERLEAVVAPERLREFRSWRQR